MYLLMVDLTAHFMLRGFTLVWFILPYQAYKQCPKACLCVLVNKDDGEREEETKVCDHQIMGFLCLSPLGSQPSVVQSRPMCVFSCLLHVYDLEAVSFALCSILLIELPAYSCICESKKTIMNGTLNKVFSSPPLQHCVSGCIFTAVGLNPGDYGCQVTVCVCPLKG